MTYQDSDGDGIPDYLDEDGEDDDGNNGEVNYDEEDYSDDYGPQVGSIKYYNVFACSLC